VNKGWSALRTTESGKSLIALAHPEYIEIALQISSRYYPPCVVDLVAKTWLAKSIVYFNAPASYDPSLILRIVQIASFNFVAWLRFKAW
jgi:hypothetical protein